jgi:3,2-trans-enoyl-CoA isomerase
MLERHDHGPIRTLRLVRPPVNALDTTLLTALSAAVAGAPADGVRALVLTGSNGRFSAGLDVPYLLTLDRTGMHNFWHAFFGCLATLAASAVPVVAAINGHSPAGGAVLALQCDRRIMALGDFRIGLNEVQVGLYPGPVIHFVLARIVGARNAADLLSTGALLFPEQALAVGLVDELVAPAELGERARAWLDQVLALPLQAYAATRALVRRDLVERFTALGFVDYDAMTDAWFAVGTQEAMKALVAKLGRR